MKDHNSGAKDKAEEGGVGGASAKVVPLPRSWYGAVDELVPIDPVPPTESDSRSSLTDASAFWGGDDGRPRGVQDGPSGPTEGDMSDGVKGDASDRAEDNLADRVGGHLRVGPVVSERSYAKPEVRARARWGRLSGSALGLALIALAVVVAIGTLSERSAPRKLGTSAAPRKPVLTVTRTIPETTTVVRTVSTRSTELVGRRATKRDLHRTTDSGSRQRKAVSTITHDQSPAASVPTAAASVPPSAASSPSNNSASGDVTRRSVSGGGSSPTAGSSKPSCAPSVTNGGGCSL